MSWLVGVDVGGTFTDFYAFDSTTGRAITHKTPSTSDDPARAVIFGLDALCGREGLPPETIQRLAHGTTVATNALIQRRGAPLALITTRGFRDLLEIGRQTRPRMYDLKADMPPPLVPRQYRFEVDERVDAAGEVVVPLSEDEVAGAVEAVRRSGVAGCAVCLLFSFLRPDHERQLGEALRQALPELFVSLSSEVQPEFREYERFSTTVLNAFLQPQVSRYVRRLREAVASRAPRAFVSINQSSGGLMSPSLAEQFPIRTALSGPAAGVVGAIELARLSGHRDVITLDMGGTSADVCLIRGLQAEMAFERSVAEFPVRIPAIDINAVGAGGGSIAWFGPDGLLKVGPISAGAEPGPACYARGGDQPTVSDANLVLGRLSPRLIGGSMELDTCLARGALKPIADRLGQSVAEAAQGVLRVVTANMVRAIRAVSVERGHDPRAFVLMPFGGAGPLHASEVARMLGVDRYLVPLLPGILCAQGLIAADLKEDFVGTRRLLLGAEEPTALTELIQRLAGEARDWFERESIERSARAVRLVLDMRYVGQNYELPIRIMGGAEDDPPALPTTAELARLYYAEHERSYGHHDEATPIEIMNVRLTAIGSLQRPPVPTKEPAPHGPEVIGTRPVWFDGYGPLEARVFDRQALAPGHRIEGPAVIDQLDATTLLWPGDFGVVDAALNLDVKVAL